MMRIMLRAAAVDTGRYARSASSRLCASMLLFLHCRSSDQALACSVVSQPIKACLLWVTGLCACGARSLLPQTPSHIPCAC